MKNEKLRATVFTRRAAIIAGGQAALFVGLGARLYYLQVVQADRYRTLADENRINLRLLAPPRGAITDRFGEMLATNVQNYRVVIIREQTDDMEATLARLAKLLAPGSFDSARIRHAAKRRRAFVPITVRENLTWDEVSRLEVNAPNLPGVGIDVGLSRYYPRGPEVAHVLGYVAAVSEADLTDDPVLQLPGYRIGKRGIERRFDATLRGKAGNSQVEVNAFGRVIRELRREDGQPGAQLTLTLDAGLQAFTAERLAREKSASAVIMNVHNGDILTMVSSPGFNPNEFSAGISLKSWRQLLRDPYSPLSNKALQGQYPPGSTFKVAVALAALEAGVSVNHRVDCRGFIELGDHKFHCWKRGGHGTMTIQGAIRESCDVFFYDIALKIGVDRFAEMARRLGLGAKYDFDLDGQKAGLIPTRAWKQAVIGNRWQKGETVVAAIGQGYVLTTPLQLAVMTARAVNGGFAVTPRLARRDGAKQPEFGSLGISAFARRIVVDAMDQVVNHHLGTARKSRIENPAMAMGGKTGTSQVRRITLAERKAGLHKQKQKPWRQRDHALFVGFAPVASPQYAVAVVVEHGGGGSKIAAPIASTILAEAQRRDSAREVETGNTGADTSS
jgi:penicillin-binding protein 2